MMNKWVQELYALIHQMDFNDVNMLAMLDERSCLTRVFDSRLPLRIELHRYDKLKEQAGPDWLHWHDYYEFSLIINGEGVYSIDGETFTFRAGDLIIVTPGLMHGVVESYIPHKCLCFFFHKEAIARDRLQVESTLLECLDSMKKLQFNVLQEGKSLDLVNQAMSRTLKVWELEESRFALVHLRLQLLNLVMRVLDHREKLQTKSTLSATIDATEGARVMQILNYLEQNVHRKILQDEVARQVGMSSSHFRVFFRRSVGVGFSRYIQDLRIEKAAHLLKTSNMSVADIASTTGFADQSHMQKLFKERFEMSPREYRELEK